MGCDSHGKPPRSTATQGSELHTAAKEGDEEKLEKLRLGSDVSRIYVPCVVL